MRWYVCLPCVHDVGRRGCSVLECYAVDRFGSVITRLSTGPCVLCFFVYRVTSRQVWIQTIQVVNRFEATGQKVSTGLAKAILVCRQVPVGLG